MTFLGSSDQFSLGSKWFWYLQNDKMCTLGPTDSPNGVRKGPRRPKNVPQNPTGPIRAYFRLFWGGAGPKFFCPFGPKKAKKIFFRKKILFALFRLPKGLGPSKTQNWPCRPPPVDPILAQFVGKKADFGVKKNAFFSKKFCSKSFFIGSQMIWDPQKLKLSL